MPMHRVFIPLSAIALIVHPALGDEALHTAGKTLFEDNCVDCHGADAKGEDGAGGDIRGVIARQVVMATGGGYESMPEVVLTEDEIAAIVAYLGAL